MKTLLRTLTLGLFLIAIGSQAEPGDDLYGQQEQKITYQVSVTDGDGKPIPYAVLWRLVEYRNDRVNAHANPSFLMERLLRRYADDVDFVHSVKLQPQLLVYHADKKGKIQFTLEAKTPEDRDGGSMKVAIAALKRGYQSTFILDESALSTSKEIVLRISRRPGTIESPEFSEFYEIRSEAENSGTLGMQTQERSQLLSACTTRMRLLAERAENSKQNDLAAVFYHYLAYMPSVETYLDSAGRVMGGGFTNGYNEKNLQRKRDYEMSLALNESNPQLIYERMERKHRESGVFNVKSSPEMKQAFLSEADALRTRFGDRLWPFDFQMEWRQMAQLGKYDDACAHLNRFHQFEPLYFSPSAWADDGNQIARTAKRRGDAFECNIAATE